MCLPIDSWCCMPRTDDYHHPTKHSSPPPAPAPAIRPTTQLPPQRNGGQYNGNGYPVHHAPAAAAEAGRKASNDDVRRAPAPGHAAPASAQDKADGTLKQQQPAAAARNGMVAAVDGARGVAHNNYYHYEPARREDAAAEFYHHHQAATAAADRESPSGALGEE